MGRPNIAKFSCSVYGCVHSFARLSQEINSYHCFPLPYPNVSISVLQEDLWSKLMIAPLFNNSVHGDVLMRRDWIDTCLKYIGPNEVKEVIDMVSMHYSRTLDLNDASRDVVWCGGGS